MQLEGSRQSSYNSAINDRAVQSLESRRIRLERIATIVLADGLAETIASPSPSPEEEEEEEEDDPPGYFDTLESSGTVSTHTYTPQGEGEGKGGAKIPSTIKSKKKKTPHKLTPLPFSLYFFLSSPNKSPSSSPSKTTPTFSPPHTQKKKTNVLRRTLRGKNVQNQFFYTPILPLKKFSHHVSSAPFNASACHCGKIIIIIIISRTTTMTISMGHHNRRRIQQQQKHI